MSRHDPTGGGSVDPEDWAGEPTNEPDLPRLPAGVDLARPVWWDAPSPGGEAELMRALAGSRTSRRPRRVLRTVAVAAAAVAAAAALLAIGYRWGDRPVPSRGTEFALAATELQPAAAVTGRVDDTAIGTWIRLDIAALEPAGPGEYYEVWMSDGEALVSAGTFHMRGDPAPVVLWSGVPPDDYSELLVTVQPEGVAEPSDRVVLRGALRP